MTLDGETNECGGHRLRGRESPDGPQDMSPEWRARVWGRPNRWQARLAPAAWGAPGAPEVVGERGDVNEEATDDLTGTRWGLCGDACGYEGDDPLCGRQAIGTVCCDKRLLRNDVRYSIGIPGRDVEAVQLG